MYLQIQTLRGAGDIILILQADDFLREVKFLANINCWLIEKETRSRNETCLNLKSMLRIVKKMLRLLPNIEGLGGIPGSEAYQIKMNTRNIDA